MKENKLNNLYLKKKINKKQTVITFLTLMLFCNSGLAVTDAILFSPSADDPIVTHSVSPTTSLDTGTTISSSGSLWIWGFRGSGQQGNGKTVVLSYAPPARVNTFVKNKRTVIEAQGGAYSLIALDDAGQVWAWGLNNYYNVCPTQGLYAIATPCKLLDDIVQIAAGEYISLALSKTGDVYTWGAGLYGQRGDNTLNQWYKGMYKIPRAYFDNKPVRLLGGAYEGGYAVNSAGKIYAWGDQEDCAFGYPSSDGRNPCIGHKYVKVPKEITLLKETGGKIHGSNIEYIAGGDGHTIVLLNNGDVYGIGRGASLGLGFFHNYSQYNSMYARKIIGNVASVYNRYVGSVALTRDKPPKLYTWGQTAGSAFPTIYGAVATERSLSHLAKGEYVVKIDGGKEHFFYTTNKGRMFGVGYGASYKLDNKSAASVAWPGKRMSFVENAIKEVEINL